MPISKYRQVPENTKEIHNTIHTKSAKSGILLPAPFKNSERIGRNEGRIR
jgi:hypothetical protein